MKRSEGDCSWGELFPTVLTGLWLGLPDLGDGMVWVDTPHYRGLRYHGFTGHSLEEGVEGVEDPGTRGADAQGPVWVDDPEAEGG